ncbi:MAG: hypothetical protein CM1200mP30_25880 [Pseudomonadota bacterium]|nr:MAG: hypothetical protein CM1200mP30_25880 [Pseudomonadota bacterium]
MWLSFHESLAPFPEPDLWHWIGLLSYTGPTIINESFSRVNEVGIGANSPLSGITEYTSQTRMDIQVHNNTSMFSRARIIRFKPVIESDNVFRNYNFIIKL